MSVRTNAGFLDSVPIGFIGDWGSDTAPDNWLLCQGQAISRTEYSELYGILGTKYGIGNGTTTFNLPDFRGRVAVGKSASGVFAELGTKTGSETIKLTVAQLPAHTHTYSKTTVSLKAEFDRTFNGYGADNWSQSTVNSGSTGSGSAVTIIQPSLVTNKIIKVK